VIPRSVACLAREVIASAGVALSAPFALAGWAGALGGPHARALAAVPVSPAPPVILVHGFASSRVSWFVLERALRADGRVVVTFDYRPWASSVEAIADRLVETVEETLALTGAEQVHLVGHSLGGVIIAQALTGRRLAGLVDVVVTLGSPFGGSPWAGVLPLTPLVRAVRAGSPLLRRLAATPRPPSVRWLAFASAVDPIVPAGRAVPDHGRAARVDVAGFGHCGMLLDPTVVAGVVAATAASVQPPDQSVPRAA
jgi:triacylglycerol lipase